ncbi:hypothetical protein RhiirA5_12339 [Rhizophagus irregularis]|uniref:Ubiquitin-like domain-containing protein n=1 Tax=Rhizophagus irregularis TaxID=588596 RepID=A0A2N0PAP6_9GLOM|nr:hypothetical protein RhiirA5_12339 [Rhizophagus irregularis]
MKITFTTESAEVHELEVDSQMELENIKALIETMTGIAPADQILFHHEQELTDPKKTLEQYGVIQDDILFLKKSPSSSQPSSTATYKSIRFESARFDATITSSKLLKGFLSIIE